MNRNKLLIVEDVEINRTVLCEIFKDKYQVLEAVNADEAISILNQQNDEIAVILLDWQMPVKNGSVVLECMQQEGWLEKIPVLVVTAEKSKEIEHLCMKLGASDVIHKPFDAQIIRKRVSNIVSLYLHKNHMEEKVNEQTQLLRKQYALLKLQAEKLSSMSVKMIDVICAVVECHDAESGANIYIIKEITKILAKKVQKYYPEYQLTDQDVETISIVSSLRDIGKILIPDYILLKPAKLKKEEYELIKSHTTKGCEIINMMKEIQDKDYQKKALEICRHHHERYDGKGYPDKLKGDEIPISAQIVSVADAYHSLIQERVYKRAYDMEEAYYMILRGDYGIFSPKLMECFRISRKEIEEVVKKNMA